MARNNRIGIMIVAACLTASSAFAADATLAPGKPAGLRAAQIDAQTKSLIALIGAGALITTVAVVVASQGGNNSTTQSPSTTG